MTYNNVTEPAQPAPTTNVTTTSEQTTTSKQSTAPTVERADYDLPTPSLAEKTVESDLPAPTAPETADTDIDITADSTPVIRRTKRPRMARVGGRASSARGGVRMSTRSASPEQTQPADEQNPNMTE